jgi:hypothetical protein
MQVLPLLGREGFCGRTHCGHPIELFIRASSEQQARMNTHCRVELSQTERDERKVSRAAAGTQRASSSAQILLAADAGANDEVARSVGSAARPSIGPSALRDPATSRPRSAKSRIPQALRQRGKPPMGHSGLAIRVVAVTGNAIRPSFEDANGLP